MAALEGLTTRSEKKIGASGEKHGLCEIAAKTLSASNEASDSVTRIHPALVNSVASSPTSPG
jgi:hypothetical protein